MITFRFAAAAIAGVLLLARVPPVLAGEPQWWTDQKARCGLPSGLAYNSWDGSCRSGGQAPPPVQVYDPLPDTSARFQAVLGRVLQVVPDLAVSGLDIGSMDGIAAAADQTYVAARYRYETLAVYNEHYRKELGGSTATLESLTAREQEQQAALAAPVVGTGPAMEELRREQGYAADWEARSAAIAEATAEFNQRSDAAAESIVQWFTVAVPVEARLLSFDDLPGRARAYVEPAPERMVPVNALVNRVMPAALNVIYPPLPRQPPSGTVDDKIAAIEQLAPDLADAVAENRALNRERARIDRLIDDARRRIETNDAVMQANAAPIEAVRKQIEAASDSWTAAADRGVWTGRNLLRAAVETAILEGFRDNVVVPEITRFAEDNGYFAPLGNSLVGQMYRDGKFVFDATAERYESLTRLLEVAQQTRQVVLDFQTYALAAIEANASPDSRVSFDLLRDKAGLLDDQAWVLMQTASGESGPLAEIGRAMLRR